MGRKETRQATVDKHSQMRCRTYKFKLDKSKLSARKRTLLATLFTQAKYLYNHILEKHRHGVKLSKIDTKRGRVPVKTPNGYESRKINLVSSQMKQGILTQFTTNVKSMMSNVKAGNNKAGEMHFTSKFTSIPLKQYGSTYKLEREKKRCYLQGLCWFKLDGIEQIPWDDPSLEIAAGKLVWKPSGYYLHVTCYTEEPDREPTGMSVGLDFNVEQDIVTSDAEVMQFYFGETERLKAAQAANSQFRDWTKKNEGRKRSSNTQRNIISLEYEKLDRRKEDAANKVVHELLSLYDFVFIQDESVSEWLTDSRYSSKVHHSILGRVIAKLKKSSRTVVIDKWTRTTGVCPDCGYVSPESLDTNIREWECPECGTVHERDHASAETMLMLGQAELVSILGMIDDFLKVGELQPLAVIH